MRKQFFYFLLLGIVLSACGESSKTKNMDNTRQNPLLTEWNTPYGVPPFDKIKMEDYKPALQKAMEEHNKEIEAIVNNPEAPDFENTIEALDRSGVLLDRISNIFFNLLEADGNDEMQALAEEISPEITRHEDNITFNQKLFQRIKTVYEQREKLHLNTEQQTLLRKEYESYIRNGVNLKGKKQERLRAINEQLASLSLRFGKNVLAETNQFELLIKGKKDLVGLPQSVVDAAAEAANEKGYQGQWLFGISKPSLIPFLQFSSKRELRKKMLLAYTTKADHNDSLDNKENVNKIVNLRFQKAQLLGFDTWAAYRLSNNMAKDAKHVYTLMDKVWAAALPAAKRERAKLQKLLQQDLPEAKLMPWDWWYYAEKLRSKEYDLDEEQLRPYFKLDNVIHKGIFYVAHRLYGLNFQEVHNLPLYHPDVKTYEVKDQDGQLLAILYMDFFPRASKRGGAWMTSFRKEKIVDGKRIIPVVSLVTNFTKPTQNTPALLSMEEVETIFHEFGHSLHGMLSQCTYNTLSGTSVYRDFVELPSQVMENWASEKEVLKHYALHYQTGEPIPDALIDKILSTRHFNQGFATVEFMAAAYLDMDWHTQDKVQAYDVNAFEKKSMDKIGLIPEIIVRYRSTYFNHIFSGDYSAGYYSYLWAEVLDADAFAYFKEKGIFDPEVATAFRQNILEKGGSEDPAVLYRRFRGKEPEVKYLIERRGLYVR